MKGLVTLENLVPLQTASAALGEEDPAARLEPLRRARVLVVDDEPIIGRSLVRVLRLHHDAVAVTGGAEALAQLAQEPPFDLVICDLMMAPMTGIELFHELRRTHPTHSGKMIFLTGGAFTPATVVFLAGLPNRRLEKPIGADALLAAIAASL